MESDLLLSSQAFNACSTGIRSVFQKNCAFSSLPPLLIYAWHFCSHYISSFCPFVSPHTTQSCHYILAKLLRHPQYSHRVKSRRVIRFLGTLLCSIPITTWHFLDIDTIFYPGLQAWMNTNTLDFKLKSDIPSKMTAYHLRNSAMSSETTSHYTECLQRILSLLRNIRKTF